MSILVKTIQTAYRTIEGSDKLSKVATHRAIISTTYSGDKYVTENTYKTKKGGDGVQTRKLLSNEKGWTIGPPKSVDYGTTLKDLEKSAGKGKPYSLLNLPGTSGNCETAERRMMVRHSNDRNALA